MVSKRNNTVSKSLYQLVKSSRCKYQRPVTFICKGTLICHMINRAHKIFNSVPPSNALFSIFLSIKFRNRLETNGTFEWIIDLSIDMTVAMYFLSTKYEQKELFGYGFHTIVIKYWWKWLIELIEYINEFRFYFLCAPLYMAIFMVAEHCQYGKLKLKKNTNADWERDNAINRVLV